MSLEEKHIMSHGYGACACSQREVPERSEHQRKRRFRTRLIRRLFFSLGLVLVFVKFLLGPIIVGVSDWRWSHANKHHQPIMSDEDWDKLPCLPYLEYQPCYEGYQCARLELPRDYFNGTTDEKISLAVIRKPAVVPVTSPYYGGALILNPGGPGGSGVGLVQGTGDALRTLVDSPAEVPGARFFDLISFDPRGVRLSKPTVHCFSDSEQFRIWAARILEEGLLTSSDAALGRLWSMSHAVGSSCERVGDEDIKHYVSTASACTDMLQLTEAHGLWREQEAKRLLSKGGRNLAVVKIPEALKHRPGSEKIQYWGFSYGTYLGATFAAMYPNRIERLVLDGVVDADDYAANLWYDNLVDTEKDVNAFYHHCARVGPSGCPLADKGSSAEDVSKRVFNIVTGLYHNPLPVLGPNPDVITYSEIRLIVALSLYSPITSFPVLAELLAGVEKGQEAGYMSPPKGHLQLSRETATSPALLATKKNRLADGFAQISILCSDGDSSTNMTKPAFRQHLESLEDLSPTIGAIWAHIKLECIGWPIRAVHRFVGPWAGKTSHPILWIGNTADPVTPVGSAHKMARGYEGSVVLTVDGPGHCSVSAFSSCTVEHLRNYLHRGILPPMGTVCTPDVVPFGPKKDELHVSGEVRMLADAQEQVAQGLSAAGGGLGTGFF